MSLHSKAVVDAIVTALQGITILAGTKSAPTGVYRFDRERDENAALPLLRVIRGQEDHQDSGGEKVITSGIVAVSLPVMIKLLSYRDTASSETYDEVVEEDVGTVLQALYAMDWEGLRVNPFPVAWQTLAEEAEEEVDHGAVIRLTPRWWSPMRQLYTSLELAR